MQSNVPIDAIFFDLDGTLLDTAQDLTNACNYVLQKYQKKSIPLSEFRHYVSGGVKMMISQSFGIEPNHPQFADIKQDFLAYYQQRLVENTQLYPGIAELLDYLDAQQLAWGVVTGKMTYLAAPILDHFHLTQRSKCLVGGDSVLRSKPDPAPLLHACALTATRPEYSIYVGDSQADILAARAAGMCSIAVTYGYYSKGSDPYSWQADYTVNTAAAILGCLDSKSR